MATKQLISTSEGTNDEAFGREEWTMLAFAGVTWGASFLFIAEGLEAFSPAQVAFLRIAFAFATLSLFGAARNSRIERSDWPQVILVAFCWMAFPFWLFPLAEQRVSSSLAGMLNGAVPIFAAGIAAILLRRLPTPRQRLGLALGVLGLVLIGLPSLGADSSALGIGLIIVALFSYGISINISVPLTQKYGSMPVLWRAQLVALAMSTPGAALGLGDVELDRSVLFGSSMLAMAALGIGGTALAYLAITTLAARVGSTRASVTVYISPPIALLLGLVFRGETVEPVSVVGMVVVLAAAWTTSRAS